MSRIVISDNDLANFAAAPVSIEPDTIELSHAIFLVMIAELRERRAADLSEQDRKALTGLADAVRRRVTDQRIHTRIDSRHERALAALDRLLSRGKDGR